MPILFSTSAADFSESSGDRKSDPRTHRTPKAVSCETEKLHFTAEFFLQFEERNLDHGWPSMRATIGQIAIEQIAD